MVSENAKAGMRRYYHGRRLETLAADKRLAQTQLRSIPPNDYKARAKLLMKMDRIDRLYARSLEAYHTTDRIVHGHFDDMIKRDAYLFAAKSEPDTTETGRPAHTYTLDEWLELNWEEQTWWAMMTEIVKSHEAAYVLRYTGCTQEQLDQILRREQQLHGHEELNEAEIISIAEKGLK